MHVIILDPNSNLFYIHGQLICFFEIFPNRRPLRLSGKSDMGEKEVVPFKDIVQDLWTGGNPLIDPLVPAVIKAWGQVIPESLRPAICLEGIREGTLHLLVSNPVAGQQLQFLKESIREKINKLLGGPVVKGIRIKTGAFPEMPSA